MGGYCKVLVYEPHPQILKLSVPLICFYLDLLQ
jgi:hypothetical protein